MEAKKFQVYKGLQRPLTYKGFKGRFIYWGLGILLCSLILGAVTMATINMYLGAILMIGLIASGFMWLAGRQKKGQFDKTLLKGIFIHPVNLQKIYRYVRQKGI